MRSVILKAALAVSAALALPGALGSHLAAVPSAAAPALSSVEGAQAMTGDAPKFAGTYALITTEQKDEATGKWAATPNFNSNGYII